MTSPYGSFTVTKGGGNRTQSKQHSYKHSESGNVELDT